MSIAKRLIEEKLALTCSECGEEFPQILGRRLIAKGMRDAAEIAKQTISEDTHWIVADILAHADVLDPPLSGA